MIAFPPKAKRTNKRGNLNATRRSRTFRADRAKRYFVLMSDGTQPVACAKLNGKKAKRGASPARSIRVASRTASIPRRSGIRRIRSEAAEGEKPGKPKGAHAAKRGCKRRG